MSYPVKTIANSILQKAKDDNIEITPMKLQKLMYYTYLYYLHYEEEPLFAERFAVWKFGPVLESLYQYFKKFGTDHIEGYALQIYNDNEISYAVSTKDQEFYYVLNKVWNNYKNRSAWELSQMTHGEHTGWTHAHNNGKTFISDEDIKKHIEFLAKD